MFKYAWLPPATIVGLVALICALVGAVLVTLDYRRKGRSARGGGVLGAVIGASVGLMIVGAILVAAGKERGDVTYTLTGIVSVVGGLLFLVLHRMFHPQREETIHLLSLPQMNWKIVPAIRKHRQAKNIFISYRRDDSPDVTGRIYDRLVEEFGKDAIFKDVDSIPFGVDFRRHLNDVVEKCDVMLAIVGSRWLAVADGSGHRRLDDDRDFVRIELEAALQRDIPVVPILVQGAQMPHEEDLPPTLKEFAYRNCTTVRHDPDFHVDMDRLIKALA